MPAHTNHNRTLQARVRLPNGRYSYVPVYGVPSLPTWLWWRPRWASTHRATRPRAMLSVLATVLGARRRPAHTPYGGGVPAHTGYGCPAHGRAGCPGYCGHAQRAAAQRLAAHNAAAAAAAAHWRGAHVPTR